MRDPNASYHKILLADLSPTTGDLDWVGYFAAAGAPTFTELNLAHPDFFKGFAAAPVAAAPDAAKAKADEAADKAAELANR